MSAFNFRKEREFMTLEGTLNKLIVFIGLLLVLTLLWTTSYWSSQITLLFDAQDPSNLHNQLNLDISYRKTDTNQVVSWNTNYSTLSSKSKLNFKFKPQQDGYLYIFAIEIDTGTVTDLMQEIIANPAFEAYGIKSYKLEKDKEKSIEFDFGKKSNELVKEIIHFYFVEREHPTLLNEIRQKVADLKWEIGVTLPLNFSFNTTLYKPFSCTKKCARELIFYH